MFRRAQHERFLNIFSKNIDMNIQILLMFQHCSNTISALGKNRANARYSKVAHHPKSGSHHHLQ